MIAEFCWAVIPAQAGIQVVQSIMWYGCWIPAFAGMTRGGWVGALVTKLYLVMGLFLKLCFWGVARRASGCWTRPEEKPSFKSRGITKCNLGTSPGNRAPVIFPALVPTFSPKTLSSDPEPRTPNPEPRTLNPEP
jgi:hypothetical protein